MAHINLLPWREELRQQKKKEFLTAVGITAVLFAGVMLAVHLYMAMLIDHQKSRNELLQQEIRLVEKKIKEIENLERQKEQLIARMRVIERLQSNRSEIVHLFDEIAKIIPDGLYIYKIDQSGRQIRIDGKAQSNARVSAFMRRLEASDWFGNPKLNIIATKKGEREFTLLVQQVNIEEEAE